MKNFSVNEIKESLNKISLKKGDLVYLNPEFYRLGKLKEATNKNIYYKIFYDLILKKIGKTGTIVSNCYSFQTLRYNKKFIFEKTSSTSGGWSEFMRNLKGSVRSKHPVFSVVAVGRLKKIICGKNSLNNYGKNSPYDIFLQHNGKILNIGMKPELNPFRHVVEFNFGVPYCYNKFTKISYYKKNKKINKIFSSFVQYTSLNLNQKIRDKMNKKIRIFIYKNVKIKRSKLGSGEIYFYNAKEYCLAIGKILNNNLCGLLGNEKIFQKGKFPYK